MVFLEQIFSSASITEFENIEGGQIINGWNLSMCASVTGVVFNEEIVFLRNGKSRNI